jgi:predicted N-formylglutamate amidohydrolase
MPDADSHTPAAVTRIDGRGPLVLLCDHATNFIPPEYGRLGLPAPELQRHIAYDIGAAALTRHLATRLRVRAVLSGFSRLLIDPNRGLDDPTLVMRLSDGAVVPGNARIDPVERKRRIERFYRPYDQAVAETVAAVEAEGLAPLLFSIHSFTPFWKGRPRPWHVGVLYGRDARLAAPLLARLRDDPALNVGDNEPYDGDLEGDTLDRHATRHGRLHVLLEVRQDLVADDAGVAAWTDRLVPILERLAADARTAHDAAA